MKGMRVVWVTALLLGLMVALVMMFSGNARAEAFAEAQSAASGQGASGQAAAAQTAPVQAAGQVDGPPVPAVSLADARALAGKGRLEQALAELNALAKVSPEEAGVERLRGIVLYQKDALADAATAFDKAVAADREDRESVEMLGITLYRLGRPGEAIPLLERAEGMGAGTEAKTETGLGSSPTSQNRDVGHPDSGLGSRSASGSVNADPHYVLGLCYTDAKRYDDARRAFATQFGFGSDSAEGYLVAARLFLRREFAEEAAVFAAKAVELNPTLPGAHQLLGEVALAKANLPLAVKELETEEKLNPVGGEVWDRLGDAYFRVDRYEDARQALNKAVLLEPSATGPYILLGEVLIKMGEPIQALHYLSRAAGMDPDNHTTHFAMGQAYKALGRIEDSQREFKLSVAVQHKNDSKPAGVR